MKEGLNDGLEIAVAKYFTVVFDHGKFLKFRVVAFDFSK